jgi:hypothetical protein
VGFQAFQYKREDVPQLPYGYNPAARGYDGLQLQKSGRSTGTTTAAYHGLYSVELKRLQNTKGPGYHLELQWTTKTSSSDSTVKFAEPGDSGAWVATLGGEVFGMVTGGDVQQGTTYVCPIKDIFDDIKLLTRATDIRIAPTSIP